MHALLGKDSLVTEWQDIIKTENNVIDGGALLRYIEWKEGEKFKEIIRSPKFNSRSEAYVERFVIFIVQNW